MVLSVDRRWWDEAPHPGPFHEPWKLATGKSPEPAGWKACATAWRGRFMVPRCIQCWRSRLSMNPKMVGQSTSPRPSPHLAPPPLPNAEREKRSHRLCELTRWVVQGPMREYFGRHSTQVNRENRDDFGLRALVSLWFKIRVHLNPSVVKKFAAPHFFLPPACICRFNSPSCRTNMS
jgi:hypothetical protein